MNKRILCAVISATMLMQSQVYVLADTTAHEAPTAEAAVTVDAVTTYTLSLDRAIELAKKSSPTLEVCDVNKKNLQIQRKNAVITQKNSKDVPVYVNTNFDLVFVKQGYYVNALNAQIKLADYEKSKSESALAYDVTQKYYGLKNAVSLRNSAKAALDRALENEELAKAQFELGMCTKLDADGVSLAAEQCKANLEACERNIELTEESLKIALAIEGECTFVLTDELETTPLEADLDADTKIALTSRYDANALKTAFELSKNYFDIASTLDNESTTYFSAYTSYIQSKYDYTTGIRNISLAIKSSYYNACDAVNQTALAKKRLDLMKTEYETTRLKAEMGMITNLSLTAKSDELTECENTYENALLNQKLAVEKYYYDIKIGL